MEFDELSNQVIGCAIEVHKRLGPGLLESSYEGCLSFELICVGFIMMFRRNCQSNIKRSNWTADTG